MIVYVADFYRLNKEHLVYNESMVEIVSGFPNVNHTYAYGHSTQINVFKQNEVLCCKKKLSFVEARVHEFIGGKQWIKKIYYELKNALKLLHQAPEDALILFLSLSPITSFFFKFAKFLYTDKKVIITLHGDLDFIQRNKSRLRNLLGTFFIWSFKVKNRNTKYLVLSTVIEQNLLKTGLLNQGELFCIHHPYRFPTTSSPIQKGNRSVLRIGHIGTASQEKNTQLIFKLAAEFEDEIRANRLEFSIIGQSVNIDHFKNDLVNYDNFNEMLSKEVFDRKISELDYVIFFYSDENHRYSSSGAVLDAISHGIPIITTENEVFKDIFLSAPGKIGYLCKDYDAIKIQISSLLNGFESDVYNQMVKNLYTYQSEYTISNIRNELLHQIKDFVYGS